MPSLDQRLLLGSFIRAHRERARPAAPGTRRRTPGLRREELAAAAGISVTWCSWIEQGRAVQPSPDALSRLARALSLTPAERAYLFELSDRLDPEASAAPQSDAPPSLAAAVRAVVYPAYGLDDIWNACCWNDAAARLFRGWLDGDHQRNLLRFVFLDAGARSLIPDWQTRARRLLAEFRAGYSRSFREQRVTNFVDALGTESPFFAQAWRDQDVRQRDGGIRTFDHPQDGPLCFEQHTFSPSERPDYKLVMLTPVPEHGR